MYPVPFCCSTTPKQDFFHPFGLLWLSDTLGPACWLDTCTDDHRQGWPIKEERPEHVFTDINMDRFRNQFGGDGGDCFLDFTSIPCILQCLNKFSVNQVKKTSPVCCFASLLKYLHTGAYIYLCVVNKLVSNVFAAILCSFGGEVSIRIPASVGRVCITCSWRGMLHSGCCDNSHRFPWNTQNSRS